MKIAPAPDKTEAGVFHWQKNSELLFNETTCKNFFILSSFYGTFHGNQMVPVTLIVVTPGAVVH